MRLLIADDDAVTRMMLEKVLIRWGYEVTTAGDGNETWQLLAQPHHPHLLLLDWVMPGIDGLEIIRRLRNSRNSHLYYIIILTSRENPGDVTTALDTGADDFIAKPYDMDELRARINVGRRITCLNEAFAENLRKLEEANETISRLAAIDELTDLPNRRSFNGCFLAALSAARRHAHPLSLIIIDLDHFKAVNDCFGHAAGDEVLKEFASLLRDLARAEDLAARWGGEEFIILLPHTSCEAAAALAERIRIAFETHCSLAAPRLLSASFGVAQLCSGDDDRALLQRADEALYRAKEQGRNRVVVANA